MSVASDVELADCSAAERSAGGGQKDRAAQPHAQTQVDVRIVHLPTDAAEACDLVAALRPLGSVVALDAGPALAAPRPTTLYTVASRLAAVWPALSGDRIVLVGLGRTGGALARALAAELLGRDDPVAAVFVLERAPMPGDDALSWSEPLIVWNRQEDLHRIAAYAPDDPSDAAAWLRERIAATAAAAPIVAPTALTLRSCRGATAQAFCIPGAGASLVSFLDLAQAAPADIGVYGLQPRGLDGTCPPYATVQSVAAALEPLIVEQLDARPFHLVGHSFGGCVAFELACRLDAKGLRPASLSLVDTRPPLESALPEEVDDVQLVRGWIRLNELAIERSMGIDEDALQPGDLMHNLAAVHRGMVRVGLFPPQTQPAVLLGPMRMFAACVRHWYHTTMRYPGPLRLVYLDDPLLGLAGNARVAAASRAAWGALTPRLDFRHGTGNHITGLKTPHAAGLAALLGWAGVTC